MKSLTTITKAVLITALLTLGFMSCEKCSGCDFKKKKPEPKKFTTRMEVTEGVKPLDQQVEEIKKGVPLPKDLLHCGDDPVRHGALPNPDQPGEFICPPELPREPVCAYYYDLATKEPDLVRTQEAANACSLCGRQFKKGERYVDKFFNQKLIGYTKGPCP
jgi:hypothetical protein